MKSISIASGLLALLASVSPLVAATTQAPTKEVWEPVARAIAAKSDDAYTLSKKITGDYPDWAHGHVKHAVVCERRDRSDEAIAAARRCLEIEPGNGEAAGLLIRVLNAEERYPDALVAFEEYGEETEDPGGWVHYQAARAAFRSGDRDRAARLLRRAIAIGEVPSPTGFRFLKARIHEAEGDLGGAIASYRRGIEAIPEHADLWFNLGILQRQLAKEKGGDLALLRDAADSLVHAAEYRAEDPQVRMALGQVHLDLGRWLDAETVLRDALGKLDPDAPEESRAGIHGGIGLAVLKQAEDDPDLERFLESIGHFEKAEAGGLRSPAVYNNLLAAIVGAQSLGDESQRTELREKANALLADDAKSRRIAPLNLALQYYRRGEANIDDPQRAIMDARLALELMDRVDGLSPDHEPAYHRYRGHVHALIGDAQASLVELGGGDEEARDRAWRNAADAYGVAGDRGDHPARENYFALQQKRDAESAYRGAWRYLGWRSYLSLDGWIAAIATYGAADRWKHPVHLVIWAVVLGAFLILGFKAFAFPKRIPEPESRRRNQVAGNERRRPAAAEKPAKPNKPAQAGRDRGEAEYAPDPAPAKRWPEVKAPRPRREDEETQPTPRQPGARKPAKAGPPGLAGRAVGDVAARLARQKEQQRQQQAEQGQRRAPRRRRR